MRTAPLLGLLATVLVLGCGESEPAPEPIVDDESQPSVASPSEPETESPAPEEESLTAEHEAPSPETEAPPLPEPRPDVVHVFVVGEDGDLAIYSEDQALETQRVDRELPDEVTLAFPRFTHPDPRLGGLINERVEAFAMRQATGEGGLEVGVNCTARLATPTLVSLACEKSVYDDRDFADTRALRTLLLAADARGVREIELASLFLPDADLPGRVRDACLEDAEETGVCNDERDPPGITLEEDGIRATYVNAMEPIDIEIAYIEVADQIRATGPLAESFERHNVTTRSITVTTDPSELVSGPPRWVASPMMSADDLASAWLSLPESERGELRALGSHLVAENEALALRAATRLGHQAQHIPVGDTALALTVVEVARDSDLLAAPDRDAEVVRRLSRGVVGVALAPLDEDVARFPRVIVHRGLAGFVDVRRLSTEDVCVPDLAPFLAGFPEGERRARRLATHRRTLSSGSWGRADFLSAREENTTVEMRRLESGCQVDRALVRFAQPGPVTRLDTTRTQRRGGDPLVVSVGPERVQVHVYGQPEPTWEHALTPGDEVRVGQRDEDRWLPIVIAHDGREPLEVAWIDGALGVP
ncbi:MAG: hypothetical protein AB8I08_18720 [Sandaracinaceae bacterium]